MSLPTIHWARFSGTLTQGARVTIPHTLKNGQYPAGVAPNAVLFDMSSGVYTESPNRNIGEYQARTSINVYLSNFDATATHYYGIIARRYHTVDGANL
jgi:hypothetical protein